MMRRKMLESFIPFSPENRAKLIEAFRNVTVSMLVGTFATALLQGTRAGPRRSGRSACRARRSGAWSR